MSALSLIALRNSLRPFLGVLHFHRFTHFVVAVEVRLHTSARKQSFHDAWGCILFSRRALRRKPSNYAMEQVCMGVLPCHAVQEHESSNNDRHFAFSMRPFHLFCMQAKLMILVVGDPIGGACCCWGVGRINVCAEMGLLAAAIIEQPGRTQICT